MRRGDEVSRGRRKQWMKVQEERNALNVILYFYIYKIWFDVFSSYLLVFRKLPNFYLDILYSIFWN